MARRYLAPNRSRIIRLEDAHDQLWSWYWTHRKLLSPEFSLHIIGKAMDIQGRIESIHEGLKEKARGY